MIMTCNIIKDITRNTTSYFVCSYGDREGYVPHFLVEQDYCITKST